MKVEEALKMLREVCAGYRGTLNEHQVLQTALQTVTSKLNESKEVEQKEEEQDK